MHKTPPENERESIFESPYLKAHPTPPGCQAYSLLKPLATPMDNKLNIINNGILNLHKFSLLITFLVDVHVSN